MLEISAGQFAQSSIVEDFLSVEDKNGLLYGKSFDKVMKRLARTKVVNSSVTEFMLLDASGKVAASSEKDSIGTDKSTDPIFLQARKKTFINDVYYSKASKEPLFAVSTPITNSVTGAFLGVLAEIINTAQLNAITTEDVGIGKTGEIYIINRSGLKITHPALEKDAFLKQVVATENAGSALGHFESGNAVSMREMPKVYLNHRGVRVLGGHAVIPEMRWAILAEISEREAFAPLIKLRIAFFGLLCMVPVVAWLIGLGVSYIITEPFYRLHRGIAIVGSGNLDYKVRIDTKDEIGQLSLVFDVMTENLKRTTASIESLNKEITGRARIENMLRESERKIRALFDQTFQFIGLMTIDGILIEANRAALEFSGIEASSVLGKPFWLGPWWIHSPELQEKLRQSVGKAASGEFIRFEATHVAKDGVLHYVDFSLKPVKDETGNVVFLIPEGRDITEYKRMEEENSKHMLELEVFYKASVGREERIIELKKEMERLKKESGRP
ncbi:MAG: PAS domain S-box protein [Candidatus Omnitrophica bacterium]|nr:PAS domain S-box protein [Candidatus Omnitrophota bacterium]